jgi:hypothetical protein
MKLKFLMLISILFLLPFSCKDKDSSYVQVKDSEREIYNSIKTYRESKDLSGPFVLQFLLVEEAQLHSYKMASGLVPVGTQSLDEHWERLDEKYTFYNRSGLVMKTDSYDANQVLDGLLQTPGADSILLSDVTQCGVGIESDPDGNNYITILLAKADS